jgi:hypothetical protein
LSFQCLRPFGPQTTRSSDQQKFPIDKNIIKGDIMYDILHNWNSSSQAAREATSSNQLKSEMAKSIVELQKYCAI